MHRNALDDKSEDYQNKNDDVTLLKIDYTFGNLNLKNTERKAGLYSNLNREEIMNMHVA